jgi:hypothetical protein
MILITIGVLFLLVPLASDAYSHYSQDKIYRLTNEKIISCRAELALAVIQKPNSERYTKYLERQLDASCGVLPKYEDFLYESSNGILSMYNWIAQKITFIPL